jgi:DNA-directed RNA polymerase subunit M/transcription elongation factor TFIIS
MSKFLSNRKCPMCGELMIFENDIIDGFITLFESYSCSECGYEVGTEAGVKFEYKTAIKMPLWRNWQTRLT